MIDLNKTYRTRDGRKVILHEIKLHNDCGGLVTYPVKGSYQKSKRKNEFDYAIWSIDGRADVVWGTKSHLDLVESARAGLRADNKLIKEKLIVSEQIPSELCNSAKSSNYRTNHGSLGSLGNMDTVQILGD